MLRKSLLALIVAMATAYAGAADNSPIADSAPDSYTVKQGDTLWGISGMFLKQPWRWPEVWKMNQEQIRNPHLIYPGQVVVLDRANGTLSIGKSVDGQVTGGDRLSPQVYSKDALSPIASIPLEAIRAFLVEPLVDEYGDNPALPTIVANQESRVIVGARGDTTYARNLTPGIDAWDIYRRAQPIKDPYSGAVLGHEAKLVAKARVVQPEANGKVAELALTDSVSEVIAGNRLEPSSKTSLMAAPPHPPAASLQTSVASIYDGVSDAGRGSVIAIAAGRDQGMEPGHLVALTRVNGTVTYLESLRSSQKVNLPDSRIGLAYVFRTFNRLSYALVMDATGPVKVGDKVSAP
ncbi:MULTISPECIES: LysM peptidoglycan-binding domain-containing protein [unclassified Uliginosibacterium]|uniref:LysM peptidoglycan-binding domain-containing protein n=1 Tax=unclassified Uliginosibacterium TaxID=2621521 RepID=UPI000C7D9047|nr:MULTISPECIES: LysM peptidoglycan-binding domain-containing protein [unclassified Uliginosibacterium]MDO6386438.1 LysM peptidoglycan-binding domain-containing protein [Uliginosibacterium sp. 31-12]PLK50282.1 peptidoglycan-binding protein [Uliginosibacterium sp. TH139]